MPVDTVTATITITPVVIQTFFKHYRDKTRKKIDGEHGEQPTDSILFDQAFHIVKAFMQLGTKNTVDSLQAFTNTHVPHPYWATVIPVNVPLSSCNQAADVLKDWFAEDELRRVVGGERWWQVRGLDGIEAEWVAMDDDVDSKKPTATENTKDGAEKVKERKAKLRKGVWAKEDMAGMNRLERVMLYIHGGGYYWGSINTHRYQTIRFARKMAGKVFMVSYRKAPQYPWPCPLHDVLASYLYLIRPPKDVHHMAIDPKRIVLAGDSAGGGLAITCLTILRDLGLPMPAGAVLISPWVDLTHSFPSIMKNTHTDIIPPHGFIHKPSTLWPVPASTDARAVPQNFVPTSISHQTPDHSHTKTEPLPQTDGPDFPQYPLQNSASTSEDGKTFHDHDHIPRNETHVNSEQENLSKGRSTSYVQVSMTSPDEPALQLRTQIQHYATNEQLTHPLVSPVLQGSLGNLCPLYIMAGDSEVLRDEIIYLAHRAACPEEYPVRQELLGRPRQNENAQKYKKPSVVRLQVFDGLCHVGPTVFSFTEQSTYAYRAIAEFVEYVTSRPPEEVSSRPFPSTTIGKETVTFDNPDLQVTPTSSQGTFSMPQKNVDREPNMASVDSSEIGLQGSGPTALEQVSTEQRTIESMVRERIDVHGRPRPMEPPSEIEALQMPYEEVGLIKEAPVKRWLAGQEEWDKKFKQSAERAERKRRKLEQEAEKLMQNLNERRRRQEEPPLSASPAKEDADENTRRWGPLDLVEDNPPPSAIAGRRDTPDALALLKIYFAPPDSPALRRADAVRAAFGKREAPVQPHRQSPAEQQVKQRILPVHGLSMWSNLMSYFLKRSTQKARQATGKLVPGGSVDSNQMKRVHENFC